jgi:hypothetical protein
VPVPYSSNTHTTQQLAPNGDPQQQPPLMRSSWGAAPTGQLHPHQQQQLQQQYQPHASSGAGSQQHHNSSSVFYSTSSNAGTAAAPPAAAAGAPEHPAGTPAPSDAHPMDWEAPPGVTTTVTTPGVAAAGNHHQAWQPHSIAGGNISATQQQHSMPADMQEKMAEQPLLRQRSQQQGEQEGMQEEAAAGQPSGRFRRLLPQLMRTLGRCGHAPSSSG